jgi:hypothetical protein
MGRVITVIKDSDSSHTELPFGNVYFETRINSEMWFYRIRLH